MTPIPATTPTPIAATEAGSGPGTSACAGPSTASHPFPGPGCPSSSSRRRPLHFPSMGAGAGAAMGSGWVSAAMGAAGGRCDLGTLEEDIEYCVDREYGSGIDVSPTSTSRGAGGEGEGERWVYGRGDPSASASASASVRGTGNGNGKSKGKGRADVKSTMHGDKHGGNGNVNGVEPDDDADEVHALAGKPSLLRTRFCLMCLGIDWRSIARRALEAALVCSVVWYLATQGPFIDPELPRPGAGAGAGGAGRPRTLKLKHASPAHAHAHAQAPHAPHSDDGAHPIPGIIASARSAWDAKLARQSTTLREAVDEYRRRYARAPPRGFEKWWAWTRAHGVLMPDEYDSIFESTRDLALIPPRLFRRRLEAAKAMDETYILQLKDGEVVVDTTNMPLKLMRDASRIESQKGFLEPVKHMIGDFEAVWSPHDTARLLVDWAERSEMRAMGEAVEVEASEDYVPMGGFLSACPVVRKADPAIRFITDHRASFDLCRRPGALDLHGAFLGKRPNTLPYLPIFSMSKTALHADILGLPYSHDIKREPLPWAQKNESRAVWRGSITGGHYSKQVAWRDTQRFRLVDLTTSKRMVDVVDATGGSERMSEREAAERYLDVKLTGKPIQCDTDGTCGVIARQYTFHPHMPHKQQAAYKYALDVDGNAWSARFRGLLTTGSVVLKSTVMPEWYHDRIQPWVHYVPVNLEYTDLIDIMAFFAGTPSHPGRDDLAEVIGRAGRAWALDYWREDDMVAYMFRLYLEYARLCAGDREAMGYVYDAMDEVR